MHTYLQNKLRKIVYLINLDILFILNLDIFCLINYVRHTFFLQSKEECIFAQNEGLIAIPAKPLYLNKEVTYRKCKEL